MSVFVSIRDEEEHRVGCNAAVQAADDGYRRFFSALDSEHPSRVMCLMWFHGWPVGKHWYHHCCC